MENETINIEPNAEGRYIIELYGKEIEISENMFDEDGKAEIKKFGITLHAEKLVKKKRSYKKKEPEPEPEIDEESGLNAEQNASDIEVDNLPETEESES